MNKTYELHLAFGVTMPLLWPLIFLAVIITFIIAKKWKP